MGISQQQAKDAILANPAPVMFVDTCIFLDIVRSPIRDNIDASLPEIARRLVEISRKTPKEVWLVTSETVRAEWIENIADVKLEATREIKKLEQRRRHFLTAAGSANGIQYAYGDAEGALQLENRLELISREFLDECLVITPEDVHSVRAMQRVKQYRPPARRGKSEPKDCEIFEVFLGLCSEIMVAGFQKPMLFTSSNTSDYSGDNAAGITQELGAFNGKFVSNLPWAMAVIDGRA